VAQAFPRPPSERRSRPQKQQPPPNTSRRQRRRLSVRALSVEKKWACANSENTIRNAKKKAGSSLENLFKSNALSELSNPTVRDHTPPHIVMPFCSAILWLSDPHPCDTKHIASPDSPNDHHAFRPEAACPVLLVRMSNQIPYLAVVLVQYVMQRSQANAPVTPFRRSHRPSALSCTSLRRSSQSPRVRHISPSPVD